MGPAAATAVLLGKHFFALHSKHAQTHADVGLSGLAALARSIIRGLQ